MRHDLERVINPTTESQCDKILSFMMKNTCINPLQAQNLFGCMRLASRIKDLKNYGWSIGKNMVPSPNGNKFAEYYLDEK